MCLCAFVLPCVRALGLVQQMDMCSSRIKVCGVYHLRSLQTTYVGEWTGPVSEQLSICVMIFFENLNLNVVFLTYSVTASFDSVDRFDGVPGKPGFDGFRFSGCQPLCSPLRNSPYYLPAPNKTIANKQ